MILLTWINLICVFNFIIRSRNLFLFFNLLILLRRLRIYYKWLSCLFWLFKILFLIFFLFLIKRIWNKIKTRTKKNLLILLFVCYIKIVIGMIFWLNCWLGSNRLFVKIWNHCLFLIFFITILWIQTVIPLYIVRFMNGTWFAKNNNFLCLRRFLKWFIQTQFYFFFNWCRSN